MKVDRLIELRPKENTSAEISDAIRRAHVLLNEVREAYARALEVRSNLILEGSKAEISENEQTISNFPDDVRQVEGIIASLEIPLKDSQRREKVDLLLTRFEEIDYERKAQKFVEFWQNEYPAHAQAIAGGLRLEVEAMQAFHAAQAVRKLLAEHGHPMSAGSHTPIMMAVGRVTNYFIAHEHVKLPGVLGSPFIPSEIKVDYEDFEESFPDWDGPIGFKDDGTRYARTTKTIKARREVRQRNVSEREDFPVWPPDIRKWFEKDRY